MRKILRIGSVAIVTGLLVLGNASAKAENTSPEELPQNTPAGKFVDALGNCPIRMTPSLSQADRMEKYRDLFHNAVDLETVGHVAIGTAWDTATEEQRAEYLRLFEDLLVKIYGARLDSMPLERLEIKNVRKAANRDIIVESEMTYPGRIEPTNIDWRVRENNGKLTVLDVIVEGVSQSMVQKHVYASIMESHGGKIDGLLAMMRDRVRHASAAGGYIE